MAKIQVTGITELRGKIRRLPENIKREWDAECSAAADDFVSRAVEDAPRDEGILIQGISKKPLGLMNYEIVSSSPYSAYVEFGTKRRVEIPSDLQAYASQFRGSGSGNGEGFFEHILGWVKRKGIRFDSAETFKSGKRKGKSKSLSIEQTAYIIYHHILLNGVRPHPYFFKQRGPVMDALKQRAEPMIKRALK